MSKPKDIAQDVWDLALCFVEDAQYTPIEIVAAVSRAIIAAKAEEREAIAQIGDALADLFDGHAMRCSDQFEIVEARGAEAAVQTFVADIRKRGEG